MLALQATVAGNLPTLVNCRWTRQHRYAAETGGNNWLGDYHSHKNCFLSQLVRI